MTPPADPAGFRVVGGPQAERRTVDWAAAFRACCAADPAAEPHRESYLSLFTYGLELPAYIRANGSTRGYRGLAAARRLWFDIDRPDPGAGLAACRTLVGRLLEEVRELDDNSPLYFFSGSKGFHVGVPLPPGAGVPHPSVPAACGLMAGALSAMAGVSIDGTIYDRVRLFRAPNSRHPKTGLHKVRLEYDELMGLDIAGIRGLAAAPRPFDPPGDAGPVAAKLTEAWAAALSDAETSGRARTAGRSGPLPGRVNRATLDFIRGGAAEGERGVRLFQAAANLGEYGASEALAFALLEEPGLDSGLPPAEVRRQIACGLEHARPHARPNGGAA